ncbi:MAG: hypothetical protein IH624_07170 [Phycisphaerae bacterium]|nr:hypothetical protein [Phycisphaerae bacterium]
MNRRQRLTATMRGEPVDRPAVSFYEIGGIRMDPSDRDPFNVYNDPSWEPLIALAETETDLIRMRSAVRSNSHESWDSSTASADSLKARLFRTEQLIDKDVRLTRVTVNAGGRTLTSLMKRQKEIDTIWTVEPLLKDSQDVEAYLHIPDEAFAEHVDAAGLIEEEQRLGDRGLVMVDTEDPLCAAATLFSMEDFTIVAMTERTLFHRLLEKCARYIHARTERVAREFPGRLWRIYGSEFASEPYLPPNLFDEYAVKYTRPMIEMIHAHAGFVRIHCHGRIRAILKSIIEMGADAIDPIEPPPHGDVELEFVRREYGRDLACFGNIEIADVENMPPEAFAKTVDKTLAEGTCCAGKGFVAMPSSSPYGRKISEGTLNNYRLLVEKVSAFKHRC